MSADTAPSKSAPRCPVRVETGPAVTAPSWSCLVGWGAPGGCGHPCPQQGWGWIVLSPSWGQVLFWKEPPLGVHGSCRRACCVFGRRSCRRAPSWGLGEALLGSSLSSRSRALRGLVEMLGDPWRRFCGGPGPFTGPAPSRDAGSGGLGGPVMELSGRPAETDRTAQAHSCRVGGVGRLRPSLSRPGGQRPLLSG